LNALKISPELAQKIVDQLRVVLQHKVNFMNMEGLIIASADTERLNQFHGGAAKVLKTKEPLFIQHDDQYEGARKGINMPIYFDNQIIGVIGVSGNSEVEKYTEVVKAMTEILIKEDYLNVINFQNREKHRLIIETLLLDGSSLNYDTVFRIDFTREYQVIAGSLKATDYDLSYLHPILESTLSIHHNIFFTISHSIIIILAPKMPLDDLLATIQSKAKKRYGMVLHFGVGITVSRVNDIKKSFETAKQALNWSFIESPQGICFFETLDVGMLVVNTDKEIKTLFCQQVFQNLSTKDLQQFMKIIEVFTKFNGSLAKCADALFIHKNTFQYQLNKIKELTGYDPRNFKDYSTLYMAYLYQKSR
jgi:carbohydrate diacid regulator